VSEARGDFARVLDRLDIADLAALARGGATGADVDRALRRDRLGLADLAALLSPVAAGRLPELARRARAATTARYGREVRLFAPLYLSNACLSSCVYCGFARTLPVPRRTLTVDEVVAEARLLTGRGLAHLLLVAGEHRIAVSGDYLVECVRRLRPTVASLAVETQTWTGDTYDRLVAAGLEGVVHYQETYDRDEYRRVHPAGWKRDFDRRLNAVERAARAGVRRIGVGALLGLAPDWRADVLALAAHAGFLLEHHWHAEVTVSLPRLRPSASGWPPRVDLSDAEYEQALAALRLFRPALGVVLSTRERPELRDRLVGVAVTHLSAGSATEPGGYARPGTAQAQFQVYDHRSVAEVAAALRAAGYPPAPGAFPVDLGLIGMD
jgi:2-iminoacetate synthase